MPFPAGYERKFGFEGFQDTHPSTPLPGTQVDVELDGVAKSTAALVAFLQKFARADGKLANGSVGVDQLAADFSVGFKAPTTWEPGVMYVLNDTVFEGAGFYTCTTPHTSGSIFEPSYWALIVDFGSQAQAAAASAAAAAASAAVAATVDGMFSAPVLSISGTPAVSPVTGDRYLVAASGTTGVFVGKENQVAMWSGGWVFSGAPKSGQVLFNAGVGYAYKFDGTSWIKRRSKLAYVSDFATFAAALSFSAAASVRLVVDDDRTLAANTSLSTSIPALSFEGGKITLGVFDLTFNGQPIRAEPEQIFDSTSTGKVKGTIDGTLCFDWWGTTSASTASSVTTNAINDCFAYIVQSTNPRAQVYFGKPNYYLSDSCVKPESFYCPQIEGRGAILNYTLASKAALVLIGGSGYPAVQGYIDGLTFMGGSTSYGIELRGQCGVKIRGCLFETHAVGLLLHNSAASTFSEFNTWRDCVFRGCRQWWIYKRTSGMDSFHGSGPAGNVICNDSSPVAARITVDANCVVYNAPCSFKAFPTSNAYPLISLGTGVTYFATEGSITYENAGYSGPLTILSGGSKAVGCISVGGWGGDFALGDLVLMQTLNIQADGVVRGIRQTFSVSKTMTGTNTAVTLHASPVVTTSYELNVFINIANYYWKGTLQVSSTPFGGATGGAVQPMASGGSNYASWGAPTFAWDGNVLTVTNANFPSSGTVSVSCRDMGDFF